AQHARRPRPRARRRRRTRRSLRAAAAPGARPSRAAWRRPQSRHRLPGRAAAVDEIHGALLVDAAARLPGPHPRSDRRRPARRRLPRGPQGHRRGEDALRRARRDGDELDSQPPPLFARGRRRSGRRSLPQRGARSMNIRSAAVLGAGTMGAQIAAHLANAGLPVLLLDLDAAVAREGLRRAGALKPDPFFTPDAASLITTGGFDDLETIRSADWIIEAVVEQLEVERPLLERVDAARGAGSIVSTNTSGISIASLADGRSHAFRQHWLGTHFFNPPRYLHLVELIPIADTDPAVVDAVARFADHRLAKAIV